MPWKAQFILKDLIFIEIKFYIKDDRNILSIPLDIFLINSYSKPQLCLLYFEILLSLSHDFLII